MAAHSKLAIQSVSTADSVYWEYVSVHDFLLIVKLWFLIGSQGCDVTPW